MEWDYKEILKLWGMADSNPSFRDLLQKKLSANEWGEAIFSYDVLGKMALIEIPNNLRKKKKVIARALLQAVKSVEAVYEKVGEHEGKYRLEKVRFLAGKKMKTVLYKEWGCEFEIAPGKVFFSPRLCTERQRIAGYVKPKQTVGVFFAGVGPYAILIAKHCKPAQVFAIEWNPVAIPLLKKNILRNKVQEIVIPIHSDVKKVEHILGQCDHIIMPAPETAKNYLAHAIKCISSHNGGFIHCYDFVSSQQPLHEAWKDIESKLKRLPGKVIVEDIRKVLQFSPRKMQVCVVLRVPPAASHKRK